MPSYSVDAVLPAVAETIGEGPFWDSAAQTLYSVSIDDGEVHIWHAPTQQHDVVQLGKAGDTVSFVIPCEKGGFLAGLNRQIVHYDWDAGQLKVRTLHEVEQGKPTRFNDAKCDPAGRLLAGTMSLGERPGTVVQADAGSLYGMDETGRLKTLDSGFSISNGLAWWGSKLYFTESFSRQIFSYDWNSDNFSVANRTVAVDFKNLPDEANLGFPDGTTVDTNGHLWVACFFGSRILRIDPEVGKIIDEVKLPARNITSCCFGGSNMDELFATSAKVVSDGQPLAGSVFRITGLGVKGVASVPFRGEV